jgi:hypothetical protein
MIYYTDRNCMIRYHYELCFHKPHSAMIGYPHVASAAQCTVTTSNTATQRFGSITTEDKTNSEDMHTKLLTLYPYLCRQCAFHMHHKVRTLTKILHTLITLIRVCHQYELGYASPGHSYKKMTANTDHTCRVGHQYAP